MKFQHLFFPDRINNYYLFAKKIVGIHVTQHHVYATVLTAQARTLTLTANLSHPVSQEKGAHHEHVSQAIHAVLKKIGSYDSLVVTIPSSHTLFKELRLPFLSKEKVSLILPHEIEPYLPFTLSEAAFDCALAQKYPDKGYSDIVVAATQKKYLKDFVHQFTTIDASPDVVTVDILALYGFYRAVAHLYPLEEQGALVAMDDTTIHVAYLHNGILKTVRSIQKDAANESKSWQSLLFTLQSFSQEYGTLQKVLFIETDPTVVEKAHAQLQIVCELISLPTCLQALSVKIAPEVSHEAINAFSFAAAYPSLFTTDFTIATEESRVKEEDLFKKQAIVTGVLTGVFLIAMLTHTIIQVHKLSSAVEETKTTIVKELRKNFPKIKSNNVTEALKVAKNSVAKEEEIWFSFSNQTRRSFLKYLSILSTKIERDVIGLNLRKLVFNKDTILLEGSVRSFDAVNQLEQELKETNLFVHVPDFQKTDFSQSLTLNAQGDIS